VSTFRITQSKTAISFTGCQIHLSRYWTGWDTVYKIAIAIVIGFVFFSLAYWRGKLATQNAGLKSALWLLPHLLGLALISYCGAFGGKGWIPFGWDFLVIGVFSLFMFSIAIRTRSTQTAEDFSSQSLLEVPSWT
jgi:hypothetical protein